MRTSSGDMENNLHRRLSASSDSDRVIMFVSSNPYLVGLVFPKLEYIFFVDRILLSTTTAGIKHFKADVAVLNDNELH